MEAEVAEATDKVVWEEVFQEDRCMEEEDMVVDIKIIGTADEEVDHLQQGGVKAQVMKNTKKIFWS